MPSWPLPSWAATRVLLLATVAMAARAATARSTTSVASVATVARTVATAKLPQLAKAVAARPVHAAVVLTAVVPAVHAAARQ